MQAILRRLLDRLDAIAEQHDEVFEPVVRRAMSAAVFDGFLRATPGFDLPERFAMSSEEGARQVRQALAEFLTAAGRAAAASALGSFHERLSAFQDTAVRSAAGTDYGDYFGWANPHDYDAEGAPASLVAMLDLLNATGPTERKIRLLAVACCRRAWQLLPDDRSRRGVEATERYAEGRITEERLREAGREAYRAWRETEVRCDDDEDNPNNGPHRDKAIFHAANAVVRLTGTGDGWRSAGCVESVASELRRAAWFSAGGDPLAASGEEQRHQVLLCRDVFGDLLSATRLAFDPGWRTDAVAGLARDIHDGRAFERLPMLGDALQDAGCADEGLMGHCRSPGPHVRGCWAVDLALDRVPTPRAEPSALEPDDRA